MEDRLAELQQLLKTEEAEVLSQRKTLAAIEQQVQRTSDELIEQFWELCNLDQQITQMTTTAEIPAPKPPPEATTAATSDPSPVGAPPATTQAPSLRMTPSQKALARKSRVVQNLSIEVRRNVEEFVGLLKSRGDCTVAILHEAGLLLDPARRTPAPARDESDAACHALVFSLFGNCFSPADETALLSLIADTWKHEFILSLATAGPFSERNSFAVQLLACYLKTTHASPFLVPTVHDTVVTACNLSVGTATSLPSGSRKLSRYTEKSCLGAQRRSAALSAKQLSRLEFPGTPISRRADDGILLQDISQLPAPSASSPTVDQAPHRWPKRAAGSPEEQLSSIVATPWLVTLSFLASHIVSTVASSLHSLPYGLRWVVKTLGQWEQTRKSKSGDSPRGVVVDFVFRHFIASAIMNPEDWNIGIDPPHCARANLQEIGRFVMDLARLSAHESPEKLLRQLNNFIVRIPQVEDPDIYFRDAIRWADAPLTLVSASDLSILLKLALLLPQTRPEVPKSDYTQTLARIRCLAQAIAAKLPHLKGSNMFLKVKDHTVQSMLGAPPRVQRTPAEDCKQNLVLLLRVMERLCGHHGQPLIQALLCQRAVESFPPINPQPTRTNTVQQRNRSLQANLLASQIQMVVVSLEQLPEELKKDDFRPLILSLFEDLRRRKDERTAQLSAPLIYLNKLQLQVSQVAAQRNLAQERLGVLKFTHFIMTELPGIDEFTLACEAKFTTPSTPCKCKPCVFEEGSNTCAVCREKAALFSEFTLYFKEQIAASPHWNGVSEDFIKLAVHNFESHVMTKIYDTMFPCLQADMEFYARCIDVGPDIPLRALIVPERFHSQAPWPLAQKELRRIVLFRAPYDKFRCIVDTWKTIFAYLRPLGEDYSPDDFLPIMAFVILQTNPPDLLSNLQYITLFACLDNTEIVWLMHIKSAVEILWQIFSGKLPMWRPGKPRSLPTGNKKLVVLGKHVIQAELFTPPKPIKTPRRITFRGIKPWERRSFTLSSLAESGRSMEEPESRTVSPPPTTRKRTRSSPPPRLHLERQLARGATKAKGWTSTNVTIKLKPPMAGEIDPLGALTSSPSFSPSSFHTRAASAFTPSPVSGFSTSSSTSTSPVLPREPDDKKV